MELSIINYGVRVTENTLDKDIKAEDDAIIKKARGIIDRQNMGKGAIVVSEVLHTGVPTSNGWEYMQRGLSKACRSFWDPALTPFLMHHNDGTEGFLEGPGDNDLISVGSNTVAQYIKRDRETPRGLITGYVKVGTFISEDVKLGDSLATDVIRARRVMQLSAGARVLAKNQLCSICGNVLFSDECEHYPGEVYDGDRCIRQIYNPMFREYSGVYKPADVDAMVRRMDVMDSDGKLVEPHLTDIMSVDGTMTIYDSQKVYSSADIPGKSEENTMKDEQINLIIDMAVKKDQQIDKLVDVIKSMLPGGDRLSTDEITQDSKGKDTTDDDAADVTVDDGAADGGDATPVVPEFTDTNDAISALVQRMDKVITVLEMKTPEDTKDAADDSVADGDGDGGAAGDDAGAGSDQGAEPQTGDDGSPTPPAGDGTDKDADDAGKDGDDKDGAGDDAADGAGKDTPDADDKEPKADAGDGDGAGDADDAADKNSEGQDGTDITDTKDSDDAGEKKKMPLSKLIREEGKKAAPAISKKNGSLRHYR